jgi:hypothetical protein
MNLNSLEANLLRKYARHVEIAADVLYGQIHTMNEERITGMARAIENVSESMKNEAENLDGNITEVRPVLTADLEIDAALNRQNDIADWFRRYMPNQ